jgi:uncharacterized membrane protein
VPEPTEPPEPVSAAPAAPRPQLCPTCHRPRVPSHPPMRPITVNPREVIERLRTSQDRLTDGITGFAGSMRFVYIHAAWFGAWIVINAGLFGAALTFDPFPYGLLTMIVSLEAIFLSTFVMISQNRQAARTDVRAELDFETNVRSEIWSVHIGRQLGLDPHEVERRVQESVRASNQQVRASIGSPTKDVFDPDSV